jgi:hypothetical protein
MGFSGGERMQAALRELSARFHSADNSPLLVGFLEGSTCGINNDASSPEIAFYLNYGAPAAGIPPRPFFDNMIAHYQGTWGTIFSHFLLSNNYSVEAALLGVGMVAGEQLQKEITDTTEPENKPWAIKAKGHQKPLEWSKNMKNSIEAELGGNRQKVGA